MTGDKNKWCDLELFLKIKGGGSISIPYRFFFSKGRVDKLIASIHDHYNFIDARRKKRVTSPKFKKIQVSIEEANKHS